MVAYRIQFVKAHKRIHCTNKSDGLQPHKLQRTRLWIRFCLTVVNTIIHISLQRMHGFNTIVVRNGKVQMDRPWIVFSPSVVNVLNIVEHVMVS